MKNQEKVLMVCTDHDLSGAFGQPGLIIWICIHLYDQYHLSVISYHFY
mgnify:CR=1 FL=1